MRYATPKTLIPCARMPFAVQAIRKLGETGHEVVAADTFAAAPGSHSRHASAAVVTPAPRHDPPGYAAALADIVRAHGVERVLPTFEEVFVLARHRDRLEGLAELFFADFELLAQLHDKLRFTRWCDELGLRVAPWLAAHDRAELADATAQFTSQFAGFFARPAYSRGGLELFTNRGPLAGALALDDCRPSPGNPWLVQPFVAGQDRCSYAIAHRGRLVAHVAYVHPRTIDGAGGITFESIDDPEMLAIGRRVIEAADYHGQIAMDFIQTEAGLVVIECNPRATAGLALLTAAELAAALTGGSAATLVAPPGRRRKISAAILRQAVCDWRQAPAALRALRDGGEDLYATADDPLPGLFQLLSYVHVLRSRGRDEVRRSRSKLVAAYLHDVRWDGEPLEVRA